MKTKQLKLVFLLISILCGLNVVVAQEKTAYEKRVLEIKKEYVKIIKIKNGTWTPKSELELRYADELVVDLTFATAAFTLSREQIESFGEEMAQAEKLKTAVDRQREKERKAEREKQAEEQKIRAEEQKILQEKRAYEGTDRGGIETNIKSDFAKWNKKGEFEKMSDYETRLQTQSKTAFDSICIAKIRDKIRRFSNGMGHLYALKSSLPNYDSEKELVTINYSLGKAEWGNQIKMPVNEAQALKSNWESFKHTIDDWDWSFVGNELCPTSITIEDAGSKKSYRSPVNLANQSEITYSFDNLEINNAYLNGYIFNYSTDEHQMAEKREKEIRKAEEAYRKYSMLFKDRDEFDTFYQQGEEVLALERKKREVINYIAEKYHNNNSSYSYLKTFDFQNKLIWYLNWYPMEQHTKFLDLMKKFKNEEYYSGILEFVINENDASNKEWKKNGHCFKDKTDFFEAYISDNYKKILKLNKKK